MSAILQDIVCKARAIRDNGSIEDDALDGILSDIAKLRNEICKNENKWIYGHNENRLYFYAIRNLDLFLKRISKKSINAKNNNDNPQITLDALSIIPAATKILKLADKNTSPEGDEEILEQLHQLMYAAANANLLESNKKILERFNKAKLVEIYNKIIQEI